MAGLLDLLKNLIPSAQASTTPAVPQKSNVDPILSALQDAYMRQGPTLAFNRRTQAPMIIGSNQTNVKPGEGLTQWLNPASHGGLGQVLDKLSVIPSMLKTGVPISSIADGRGLMQVNPTPNDPEDTADTFAHETIHSVLDHTGMTPDDFDNLFKNHPPAQRLMKSMKGGGRTGIPAMEIAAYVRNGDSYLPNTTKKDRDAVRDTIGDFVQNNKKNPRAAATYKYLADEGSQ